MRTRDAERQIRQIIKETFPLWGAFLCLENELKNKKGKVRLYKKVQEIRQWLEAWMVLGTFLTLTKWVVERKSWAKK